MRDPHAITRQEHERCLRGGLADAAQALRLASRHDDEGIWADAILAVAAVGAIFNANDEFAEHFRHRLCMARLGALQALQASAEGR